MSKVIHFKAFVIPIIFFVILAEFATFNAPEGFSRLHHSYSKLGAQTLSTAWMMNVAWIVFGVLVVLLAVFYHQKEELPQAITYPMIVFGISVILLGIWRSDNVFHTSVVNLDEARDHMAFYCIALGSLILSMILHALIAESVKMKWMHFMAILFFIFMILLLSVVDHYMGLFERIIWAFIFIWLITLFGRIDHHGNINRL